MRSRRRTIARNLAREPESASVHDAQSARYDAPRRIRQTVIDFSSLCLPEDVRLALAQAFWSHVGARSGRTIKSCWASMLTFDRFAAESHAVMSVADLNRTMLVRYIEWLNAQQCADDRPWAISSRASVYGALRQLLRWLERCRPDLVGSIEYPFIPFPGKGSDRPARVTLSAHQLRAILRACEEDIARMRAARESAAAQRAADRDNPGTLGWVLEQLDRRFGGIIPDKREVERRGNYWLQAAVRRHGGAKQLGPYLYPRAVSLLPYYLAILIHSAGNPEAIADLTRDCLQPLPLLDDRELLVWFKARASRTQRRSFDSTDPFGPPALVRDILAWNERLLALAPPQQRDRLFIFKGVRTVNVMSIITVHHQLGPFCKRHSLPIFAPACIRPTVLACFYRVSGDLLRAKAVANHVNLATTVRYVETPLVQAKNRSRIADLQGAFLEHVEGRLTPSQTKTRATPEPSIPSGRVVTMFGFDCKDPFAGVAPGTQRGELCTNFMGCFTCPNAIIPSDPSTVARLLQARDHLQAAAATLHPARWEALYAPQLRILEEDILPRFGALELAAGKPLLDRLPPLPDLR
jgi:hypothetical protein